MNETRLKHFFRNLIALALLPALAASMAIANLQADSTENDDRTAVEVADQLSSAIGSGDIDTLRSLLSPEVLIFEAGGVESSLAEYESHHMKSDMAFMASMEREVLSRQVIHSGNAAIVMTRSRLSGHYKEKDMDLASAETLVMERSEDGWKIQHIHWSSR